MGTYLERQLRQSRELFAVAYGRLALVALARMNAATDIDTYNNLADEFDAAVNGYRDEGPYGEQLGPANAELLAIRSRVNEPKGASLWAPGNDFTYASRHTIRRDANTRSRSSSYDHMGHLILHGYITPDLGQNTTGEVVKGWRVVDKHTNEFAALETVVRNVAAAAGDAGAEALRLSKHAVFAAVEAHLEHEADRIAAQRKHLVKVRRGTSLVAQVTETIAGKPQDVADATIWQVWEAAWAVTEAAEDVAPAPLPGRSFGDQRLAARAGVDAAGVLRRRVTAGLPVVPAGVNDDDPRATDAGATTPAVPANVVPFPAPGLLASTVDLATMRPTRRVYALPTTVTA